MFIKPDHRLTRRLPFNLICAVLIFLAASHSANADELAVWNFNDSNLNVDRGNGTLTSNIIAANILFAAGTTNNARLGDIAGQALSLQGGTGTANNGRNLTFNVSTLGFSNIVVSFATQGTSTGFNSNQFQYSLDGLSFIDFGSPYVPLSAFGSVPVVFTLSSILGLEQQSKRCVSDRVQRRHIRDRHEPHRQLRYRRNRFDNSRIDSRTDECGVVTQRVGRAV